MRLHCARCKKVFSKVPSSVRERKRDKRMRYGLVSILLLLTVNDCEVNAGEICPKGHFPCDAGVQCVRQRFMCDGRKDCEDGSDELRCSTEEMKKYYHQFYKKRPDEDLEERGVECAWIHPGCKCKERSYYCANLDLLTIPKTISPHARELVLAGNSLNQVHRTDFPVLKHLQNLTLASSGITNLSEDVFAHLPNMKQLCLRVNELTYLKPNTFSSSSFLEDLDLSHNPITEISPRAFNGLTSLSILNMGNCSLTRLPSDIFRPLTALTRLFLDNNRLMHLEPHAFGFLTKLKALSLMRNNMTRLEQGVFSGLVSLETLALYDNNIYSIQSPFEDLQQLRTLDLQDNSLVSIPDDTFWPLVSMEYLNLRKNPLRSVTPQQFAPLSNLTHIYFSDFTMCHSALHVRVCEPRGDGISSLAHLLDNVVLRVSAWVVGTIACLGNLLVLVGRILFREQNEVHSFYIKNLALSDLLMGIYLIVIAFHDVQFRGEYIRHDYVWRHSIGCTLCGLLSTVSSEASVFTLTVITVDRFVSIMYPLSLKKRTLWFAVFSMAVVWLVTVMIAAVPVMWPDCYGKDFYGNNGVCLPLHIHDPASRGWKYSAFVFCTVNSVAFIFIAYAYLAMFFTITKSNVGLRSTQQLQDSAIAKRFAFIVGTDFLCWMPIVIIKVVVIAGTPISDTLYAWVAVFLLPVNSALNPILYTLTTRLFKQQLRRFRKNLRWMQKSAGDAHSWSSINRCSKKTLPEGGTPKSVSARKQHTFPLRSVERGPRRDNGELPVKRRYEDFV
ncbi:relaxin receptor 2-like isoform X2 [Ornithodoros turicata]|uniref:relaxin receptor 2-like isoform X2 n=1 Tax=Ornithodoros turicata TaxID=34597 RepID=UPI00313900EF